MEGIVYNYLATASSMRHGATEGQLRSAAKTLVRAGKYPAAVADALNKERARVIQIT